MPAGRSMTQEPQPRDLIPAAKADANLVEDDAGLVRLRSEEHTSELQSHVNLVCRLLLEKKKKMLVRVQRARAPQCYLLVSEVTKPLCELSVSTSRSQLLINLPLSHLIFVATVQLCRITP